MKFKAFWVICLFVVLFVCDANAALPLRVGVVLSTGGLLDSSFNDAAYTGVMQLRKEDNTVVEVIDPQTIDGIEPALKYFCERKMDLICAIGVFANDAIRNVAAAYPDSKFVLVDSIVSAENVLSVVFDEEQGSFFAGAYAALISTTKSVGFLGGMKSEAIESFENGFKKGVNFVNPEIKFVSKYLGTTPDAFNMVEKAQEVGAEFAAENADIVYHAAGRSGLGLIQASRHGNFYVIGVDSDQSKVAPGRVIASVVKRIDIALVKAAEIFKKGSFNGGVWTLGVADDGIGLVFSKFNTSLLTPEVNDRLEEIEAFVIHKGK